MKTNVIFFVLMFGIILNINAQIQKDSLIGYWPFNGNANDESSNANHGTVNGATLTTDRFGNPNSAYSFNGIDNFIEVPHSQSMVLGTSPYTISVWVNRNKVDNLSGSNYWIISKERTTAPDGFQFRLEFRACNNCGIPWKAGFAEGHNNEGMTAPITIDSLESNRWYNLVITKKEKKYKLYLDGQLNDSTESNGTIIDQSNNLNNLIFGATLNATDTLKTHFYSGKIDDILIFKTALNSSEIQSLYNNGMCFQTIYDTIHTTVYDTIHVAVYDTTRVMVYDTIPVYHNIAVTDTLIIDITITGLNPPENINTFKVYPNPSKSVIFIQTGKNYSSITDYTIRIVNSQSQTVFESKITQQLFEIDVSNFGQTGLYFIQIIDNTNQVIDVRKIILE